MNDREKRGSGISVLAARHDDDEITQTVSNAIELAK